MRSPKSNIADFTAATPVDARCRAARRHEERGEYERACELLAPAWGGPGTRPDIERLDEAAAAELLMRAGSLTGWLGSKRQIEGWQELSKNLLSEAADRFDALRDETGWGRSQKCLALCYWREGALSEARAIVNSALERISVHDDLWISLKLTLAILDKSEGRDGEALTCLRGMSSVVARCASELIRGHYHTGLGNALENTGDIDGAIIEATAAHHYFEAADYTAGRILALINLANLHCAAGNLTGAHRELDRAERLARGSGDRLHLAHLKDSRALFYLAEEKFTEAERAARQSVAIFEEGDEYALLCRSLQTRARALARMKEPSALAVYVRAYELAAERIGSRRAAEIAMEAISELAGTAVLDAHVKLDDAMDTFEASIIRAALSECGSITAAALRLGLKQQTLSVILQRRHAKLHPPARPRSIIQKKK